MNRTIRNKIVLIAVGVLVLIQLLFYNAVQSKNVQHSKNSRAGLAQEIEELSVTKQELEQYLTVLQKSHDEIASMVPQEILQGFEDPEVILAGFLDYLKASELERMDAKVTLQGARKFVEKPVPLYEHDLLIAFSYIHPSDAGKLLTRILDQDTYPLTVRKFELQSKGRQKISGTMQISLLIPARQNKILSGTKVEER